MKHQPKSSVPPRTSQDIARVILSILQYITQLVVFDIFLPCVRHVGKLTTMRAHRLHKKYRRLWRCTNRAYRLYIVGSAIMLVWFLLVTITRGAWWPAPVMFGGYAIFFWAFLAWSRPVMLKVASSSLGRWGRRVMHGFFLVFAVVIARNIVAGALDMPPQYFEITVSLVALIAYIPVCVGASLLLMLGFFLSTFILWVAGKLLLQFVYFFIVPFAGRTNWLNRVIGKIKMRATKVFFHAIGAFVVALVLAASLDGFTVLMRYATPGIRWFAYMADFQAAGRYPGVPCTGRIRLQDNGVVAIAEIVGNDVAFRMENFKSDTDVARDCNTSLEAANGR